MGEGSFGEVYKVRSCDDGRLYAVKKSRQRFRGQWDRRQKLTEVEKHERLPTHPNCVKFYRAWEERECLYIQTELCEMRYREANIVDIALSITLNAWDWLVSEVNQDVTLDVLVVVRANSVKEVTLYASQPKLRNSSQSSLGTFEGWGREGCMYDVIYRLNCLHHNLIMSASSNPH